MAPAAGLLRSAFSTAPLPVQERFEHWRAMHETLNISVRHISDAKTFAGNRTVLAAHGGQAVSRSRYTANEVSFGREGRDLVMLSLTTSGAVTVHNRNRSTVVQNGGLVLLEADSRTSTSVGPAGHEHVFLALPRAKVVGALKSDVLGKGDPLRDLQHTPLAPFLSAQLRELGSCIDSIPADAAMVVLSSIEDMVLAALRQAGPDQGGRPTSADRHLYEAASRYMRQTFADPDLTSAKLAAAMGCSRTHLYDVFSLFRDTVSAALRDIRLTRARRLLETTRLPTSDIARAVGYRNESAFARAFNAAYQTNPQAYRMGWMNGATR